MGDFSADWLALREPADTAARDVELARRVAEALADALARVLSNPQVRADLARGARAARDVLPTWDDAAERMARILSPEEADGRLQR